MPLAWCTQCGTEMVASMLVTEMSSPLLHLREMLKELGVRDTELNLLVDVLFAATGVVWVLHLAPGQCPACRRVIWADDLDFCYPLNRQRTLWRAGCNEHDGGCGFKVEGVSFEDVMRLWNGL